jgi:hypothetical protein
MFTASFNLISTCYSRFQLPTDEHSSHPTLNSLDLKWSDLKLALPTYQYFGTLPPGCTKGKRISPRKEIYSQNEVNALIDAMQTVGSESPKQWLGMQADEKLRKEQVTGLTNRSFFAS